MAWVFILVGLGWLGGIFFSSACRACTKWTFQNSWFVIWICLWGFWDVICAEWEEKEAEDARKGWEVKEEGFQVLETMSEWWFLRKVETGQSWSQQHFPWKSSPECMLIICIFNRPVVFDLPISYQRLRMVLIPNYMFFNIICSSWL